VVLPGIASTTRRSRWYFQTVQPILHLYVRIRLQRPAALEVVASSGWVFVRGWRIIDGRREQFGGGHNQGAVLKTCRKVGDGLMISRDLQGPNRFMSLSNSSRPVCNGSYLSVRSKRGPETVQNGGAKVIGAKRACKFGGRTAEK
jgi:hypothetical protein